MGLVDTEEDQGTSHWVRLRPPITIRHRRRRLAGPTLQTPSTTQRSDEIKKWKSIPTMNPKSRLLHHPTLTPPRYNSRRSQGLAIVEAPRAKSKQSPDTAKPEPQTYQRARERWGAAKDKWDKGVKAPPATTRARTHHRSQLQRAEKMWSGREEERIRREKVSSFFVFTFFCC